MKKALLIFILLSLFLFACHAQPVEEVEEVELFVFAASSLTETFEEIGKLFEATNPGVKLIFTFDSSGTLKTQIESGALADVFVSAAYKQINELEALDFVLPGSRVNVVENKITLAVPTDNPKNVQTFADLSSETVTIIALGNSDVPVGQYSEELLIHLSIWEEIQPKVTFGSNVKEVTTWLSEGVADAGIVYKTDAFSANLKVVDEAGLDLLNTPVVYPGAVIKTSQHPSIAQAFLDFLRSNEAQAIFTTVGFSIPE